MLSTEHENLPCSQNWLFINTKLVSRAKYTSLILLFFLLFIFTAELSVFESVALRQISILPKTSFGVQVSVKRPRQSETASMPPLFVFVFIQACEIHRLLILKSLILKSEVQSMKYRSLVPAFFFFTQLNTRESKLDPFILKLLLS